MGRPSGLLAHRRGTGGFCRILDLLGTEEVVKSPCLRDCSLARAPISLDYGKKKDRTMYGWRNRPPPCSWETSFLRQVNSKAGR